MSAQSNSSVIYRKALNGREEFDARAMSWCKALRLSLERGADNIFDLAVVVRALEQFQAPLAELKSSADGDRLIVLLDGHGGARGGAIFDRGFVQSIVESQTRGRVSQTALEERPFTGTDAAVMAPLINGVLGSVDDMMADTPERPRPLELRFGDRVPDSRALLLALEAPDYELFRVTVDIADGARSGEMILLVPDHMLSASDPVHTVEEGEPASFDLRDLALTAPVMLDTVLDRVQMPLNKICALEPGMLLPISRAALHRAELVGTRGHVAAKVCLGQINGFRAVRIGERDPAETGPDSPRQGDISEGMGDRADKPKSRKADLPKAKPVVPEVPALTSKPEPMPDLPLDMVDPVSAPDLEALLGAETPSAELPDPDGLPELPDLPMV